MFRRGLLWANRYTGDGMQHVHKGKDSGQGKDREEAGGRGKLLRSALGETRMSVILAPVVWFDGLTTSGVRWRPSRFMSIKQGKH